jgi:hypothetical protein
MRLLRFLGVGVVVLVGLIGAVPAANAGGPPENRVMVIGPIIDAVDCDGESITRTLTGWLGIPTDAETPFHYHLTWEYSNTHGKTWTYIDTGLVRSFERNGALYLSLSGRSINVGPGDTGWIGHWELNTETNDVSRAGHGVGAIDQLACSKLAS